MLQMQLLPAAQTAEASVYVPAEFAAVQDSMKAINAAIEVQKSKLFKKFGPIELKLDANIAAANKVATDAGAKKEEVKKEAETLLTDIKAVIDENGTLMKKAPRGKEGAAVLEQMKTEMTQLKLLLLRPRLHMIKVPIWMPSTRSKLPRKEQTE